VTISSGIDRLVLFERRKKKGVMCVYIFQLLLLASFSFCITTVFLISFE
jgi:hypothetical protein